MVLTKSSVQRSLRKLGPHLGKEYSGAMMMVHTLQAFLDPGHPIFGHPGGAILPFYGALINNSYLIDSHVFVVHEQIGGHAAQGASASSGKLGVAVGTSGPGATNLVTPCGDAWADSNEVLLITGNVNRALSGSRAFQEVKDIKKMFYGAGAKMVYHIESAGDLPYSLAEAIVLAQTGRPGPVLVDVPKDVQTEQAVFSLPDNFAGSLDELLREDAVDDSALSEIARRGADAKRPLVLVGGGVKLDEAWDELREFVKLTGSPVAYTLKGKGVFPDSSPLCVGAVGMHGPVYSNLAVEYADFILAVGMRFSDRVVLNPALFAPNAWIAHMDKDPQGIGPPGEQQRQPDLVVKGNARTLLRELNGLMEKPVKSDLSEWYGAIEGWKNMFPLTYEPNDLAVMPQAVISTLNYELSGPDFIWVTEVGQNQMFAMQWAQTDNPLGFLTSGGFGTMGYGVSSAFGASRVRANKNKLIVVVAGESSVRMMLQTFQHYFEYQPNIKIMVLDNALPNQMPGGMVSQWQNLQNVQQMTGHRYNLPSIPNIARGNGIKAFEVKSPADIKPSIRYALEMPEPFLISFKEVERPQDVYPMMQPGKTVWDTILGPGWSTSNVRLKQLRDSYKVAV